MTVKILMVAIDLPWDSRIFGRKVVDLQWNISRKVATMVWVCDHVQKHAITCVHHVLEEAISSLFHSFTLSPSYGVSVAIYQSALLNFGVDNIDV